MAVLPYARGVISNSPYTRLWSGAGQGAGPILAPGQASPGSVSSAKPPEFPKMGVKQLPYNDGAGR